MLGRKTYSEEEISHSRAALQAQLAAYNRLVAALSGDVRDAGSQVADFEPLFLANLTLALDRYFVHRVRPVAGKDCNPLNEVELVCDSLMNNGGILRDNKVLRWDPDRSVLRIKVGDRIRLTPQDFERLSAAFFAELESRFR